MLAFNNGWEYRKADSCATIHGDSSTSGKNFANFGTVTSEILFLIFMGGWVHTWPKYTVRWFLKVIR